MLIAQQRKNKFLIQSNENLSTGIKTESETYVVRIMSMIIQQQ